MYIPFTFLSNVNLAFNGVVEYLIVAGGASGGGPSRGGGGGAGGVLTGSVIIAPSTTYNLSVGGGGVYTGYQNGSSSIGFNNSYTAIGGGTGGDFSQTGSDGGSGGGGSGTNVTGVIFVGGLGTVGQGFNGGFGRKHPSPSESATGGGGGGGASENGGDTTILLLDAFAGNGGDGISWIDGNYYGGGGGGCGPGVGAGSPGAGGLGGGGAGSNGNFNSPGGNGGANTGGGGGGGRSDLTSPGGNGGSGVIKIRYNGPAKASGGNITFDGVYTTHTFNSSSTFQTFDFILPSGSVPVLPYFTYLRYDVDINCVESNPIEVFSYTYYTDGLYLIGGTLYRLTPNSHTTVTTEILSATSSICIPSQPTGSFPILSGSLVIWNDTTSLTGSTWFDLSGKGNHGLVSGSTLSLSGSLGYEFNGTNNYVSYESTLVGQPSASWTMQYYGSLPSESLNRDFFCKDFYNDGWDILYRGGTDDFVFRDSGGGDRISSIITPTLGQKQLITITAYEVDNEIKLYINSSFIGNFSGTSDINPFNDSTQKLKFGFNANGDATYWKGGVTALLLYNKVLDATEVSQSYTFISASYL